MNQTNVKVSVLNFLSHSSSHSFSLSLDLLHFFHSVYLMPLYAFCFLFTQGFDSQCNLYKPIQHLIEDADVDITTAEELIQVKKDNSNDYKKPPHTILNEEEAEEIPVHGSEGGWVEMIQRSISRSEDLAVSFIFVGIIFWWTLCINPWFQEYVHSWTMALPLQFLGMFLISFCIWFSPDNNIH